MGWHRHAFNIGKAGYQYCSICKAIPTKLLAYTPDKADDSAPANLHSCHKQETN